LFIAATMSVPWGMSEYQVAGLLNGGPVDVVKAPLTGLPVPASAEVVLEGEAPPPSVESRVEGPWGEATGYYASAPESKAVVRVRSISYRDEPIVHGAPPLKPFKGMKHFPVSTRTVTLWNDLENCSIPAIQGVWEHTLGMIVISLQQKYAGHARQALLIAAGSRSTAGARFITVVDDDMDPTSINEVIWAMTSRCDPERDIEVICEGWTGAIDPLVTEEQCARRDFTAGKVLVNACRPLYRRASFPAVVEVSPVYKARVLAKWPDILN
jgi:4-hydroxy-3-polyprenylbenzoate decarboxylase